MRGDRKTIVCVEDDPQVIKLIQLALEREGFNLVGALGGQEGLDAIRQVKPDLVLIDIMMPDVDGWEVCHRMKAEDDLKDIPIIILTVRTQNADRMLGLHIIKADAYVTKPFEIKELVHRISQVLDSDG